jgi:hypothetical protein
MPAPAFQAGMISEQAALQLMLVPGNTRERGSIQVLFFSSSRTACSRSKALSVRAAGFASKSGEAFW